MSRIGIVKYLLQRCAVCGFRRYTHTVFKEEFYTVSLIGDPPERPWYI